MKSFVTEWYVEDGVVSGCSEVRDVCRLVYLPAESLRLKNITELAPFRFFTLPL